MVGGYVFETSLGYLYKETCEDQKEKKEKKKEEEEGKEGRKKKKKEGRGGREKKEGKRRRRGSKGKRGRKGRGGEENNLIQGVRVGPQILHFYCVWATDHTLSSKDFKQSRCSALDSDGLESISILPLVFLQLTAFSIPFFTWNKARETGLALKQGTSAPDLTKGSSQTDPLCVELWITGLGVNEQGCFPGEKTAKGRCRGVSESLVE
jgi:hypothetical protein